MRYQPPTPPRPTPTVMATATLRNIKLVVNRFGGKAVPSDFSIIIGKPGSNIHFAPVPGIGAQVAVLNLVAGRYDLSETPTPGYRRIWSGVITAGGRVLATANQVFSVTSTNFDMMPGRQRETIPAPSTPRLRLRYRQSQIQHLKQIQTRRLVGEYCRGLLLLE
jgi:hypothetical protein